MSWRYVHLHNNDLLQSGLEASDHIQSGLAPVRTMAATQQLSVAPPVAPTYGLWGALGSVMKAARPYSAPLQRGAARSLQLVATRDGSALRLYAMTASVMECWQVC